MTETTEPGQVDARLGERERVRSLERAQLRRLRLSSWLEASSLLVLVLVAVPLKHLLGQPLAVRIVGPLHGLAFLFYVWTVIETVSGARWSKREIARVVLVAFLPFGGFTNRALLDRKEAALDA
jgi:integral membrane protein